MNKKIVIAIMLLTVLTGCSPNYCLTIDGVQVSQEDSNSWSLSGMLGLDLNKCSTEQVTVMPKSEVIPLQEEPISEGIDTQGCEIQVFDKKVCRCCSKEENGVCRVECEDI